MSKVSDCIQNDVTFTQKGIQKSLQAENILISQPIILLCLKDLEITRKKLQKVSERVLSAAVIAHKNPSLSDTGMFRIQDSCIFMKRDSTYILFPKKHACKLRKKHKPVNYYLV